MTEAEMTETKPSATGGSASSADLEDFLKTLAAGSWELFTKEPVTLILATLVAGLISGLSIGILAGPMSVGTVLLVRKLLRGEEGKFTDIFDGFKYAIPSIITTLLLAVMITVGTILLVLPGIIVALFAAFTFHEMAFKDAGVKDSIMGSFELVKANIVPVLILFVCLMVLNAVGSTVVIGSLITGPLGVIATVMAYERFTGES